MMKTKIYHNGDDVFIAWKPDGIIPGCRGFALLRRRNGKEEIVSTWVGFEGQEHKEGERRPSIIWPIQKYQWSDYMANPGDKVQYRVIPMIGPDKEHLQRNDMAAGDWTDEITLNHEFAPNIEAYFNRGIVAAQWVSRRLGITDKDLKSKTLKNVINQENDPFRNYLCGPLGARLFELLATAAEKNFDIFAALYELDDKQLENALVKCGQHAHVILANGSVKRKGEDQNIEARTLLKSKIDLHDRMISPQALGHNKFMVICDSEKKPRRVWTGSLNWTDTGLCTQANNSVLIDDANLANEYRKQWDLLNKAGSETPRTLKESNSLPRKSVIHSTPVSLWFTPTIGQVDLNEAREIIGGAKQAILFLMFNPGPRDTLLNKIIEKAKAGNEGDHLYIRGAINQDPSTTSNPLKLFQESQTDKMEFDVVLPANVDSATEWFSIEMKKLPGTCAMVHSKVVLVDPFGANPVLMTGSHNLGPKASGTNDENLLIIRDAPNLMGAYATNIMSIYNQYRWRFRRQFQTETKRWNGLKDNDWWQNGYLKPGSIALSEINFWVGE